MGKDKFQCPVVDCRREYTDIRMLQMHAKWHANGRSIHPTPLRSQDERRTQRLESPIKMKEKSRKSRKRRSREDSPHPRKLSKPNPAARILKQLIPSTSQAAKFVASHRIDLRTPSLSPDTTSDDDGIVLLTPPQQNSSTASHGLAAPTPPTQAASPTKKGPTWATRPRSPSPPATHLPPSPIPSSPPTAFRPSPDKEGLNSPFAALLKTHFARCAQPGQLRYPPIGDGNAYDPFVQFSEDTASEQPSTTPNPAEPSNLEEDVDKSAVKHCLRMEDEVDELDEDDINEPPNTIPAKEEPKFAIATSPKVTPSAVLAHEEKPKVRVPDSRAFVVVSRASILRSLGDLFHAAADLTATSTMLPVTSAAFPDEEAEKLVEDFLGSLYRNPI